MDVRLLLWLAILVCPFLVAYLVWQTCLLRDEYRDELALLPQAGIVVSVVGALFAAYALVQTSTIENRPYDWLHATAAEGRDAEAAETADRLSSMTFYESGYMPEWAVEDMTFMEPICEQTRLEAAHMAFETAIHREDIAHGDLAAWHAVLVRRPQFANRFWRNSASWPQFRTERHQAQIEFAESLLTLDRDEVRRTLKEWRDTDITPAKHDHFVMDELISRAFRELKKPLRGIGATGMQDYDHSTRVRKWCVIRHVSFEDESADAAANTEPESELPAEESTPPAESDEPGTDPDTAQ